MVLHLSERLPGPSEGVEDGGGVAGFEPPMLHDYRVVWYSWYTLQ